MAALIAGVTLMVALAAERWADGFSVTRLMRVVPFAALGPVALCILGLNRGANLLSAERREGTLPLLILTRLTGYDIVAGKLLQALLAELSLLLAITPALVMPLLMAGYRWSELVLVMIGSLNVLFFGLALGILASLFINGSKTASCCLLLFSPVLVYATPLGFLIPRGALRECLAAVQYLNPCAPLMHVGSAAGGIRPTAYWIPLLTSHATGWCFCVLAGFSLPRSCRWTAGASTGAGWTRWLNWRSALARALGSPGRQRLLDRNPVLWLAGRDPWPTVQMWLLLIVPSLLWAWLIWLAWAVRGINITIVLVVAAAVTWLVSFVAAVPREACRRLVEDRSSGALELLLCTPLNPEEILRGEWLSLRRRYLLPFSLITALSIAFMTIGYLTFGFGGMLDPEDRGVWLFAWAAGIGLLPCMLAGLCWVSMRRAMLARNAGEASGIALLQVLGVPAFCLWFLYMASLWAQADLDWRWIALLFVAAFGITPLGCAWYARALILAKLRLAAANRYTQ